MKKYIYGFDLSMSCTGISIFSDDAKPVLVTSVDTKSEKEYQMKLKLIADKILEFKNKYPPEIITIEKGFFRFITSTEVVFRVHGLVQYLFWDTKQILYAPTTIKKSICGFGNATKDVVQARVREMFPEIIFKNNDESDSVAFIVCHFKKTGAL
jgi:Holliday junction resolvasome RuvABC endonuclease subunit